MARGNKAYTRVNSILEPRQFTISPERHNNIMSALATQLFEITI
jgi:hypothetical protein